MRGDQNPLTLGGTVPAGLGSLPNLRFLEMWRLGLTGSIPAELGNLSNLEDLRLDQNELTGSIPTGLGSLSNLTSMSLSINQLSGGIPSDFGNLSSLEGLQLDRNFLGLATHPTAGSPPPSAVDNPIPASLGNLSKLQSLSLSDSNFSGSIPAALGNLGELRSLHLDGNDFDGSIPSALGNLTKLEVLSLWGNQLDGSIPSQLGNLAALEYLDLAYNGLQNRIPSQLGRLSKLKELYLNENQLSGSIPSALGDLTNLDKLSLDTNRLNGSIPADLGDLTQLRDLNLSRNELSGAIPAELGDMTSLESLNLDDNGLTLDIPSELGDLQNVDYINLSCNFLTGNIPSELGDIGNLKSVDPGKLRVLLLDNNKLNIEAADVPASLDNIGFARLTSDSVCPRGQPDADPPSTDEVPPTFEMAELSRDGLTIVLTYNESLDSSNGPATTDFTVKVDGQAVTVSTVDVRIREVSLGLGGAVTENQGVTVGYTDPTSGNDENAIQDRSGNDAADLSERTVTNESTVDDDVAPIFQSVALSTDGNKITLTYDEILNNQAGPGTASFAVMVEGERRSVSSVRVNNRQVELRLSSPVTVGQTVTVSYFDPTTGDDGNAIQDRSGNDAATLENEPVPNDSQAQDNRAPRLERAAMSTDGLSITLVYDEALDDAAGPAASDFAVEVDGESADLSSNSAVTVSGRNVVLRLASAVRELQDVTVSYTDPTSGDDANAIQDAGGNDAADLDDHKVTNASTVLDQQPPVFQSVAMSTDGATITLTYDEVLDSANGPATANFQLMVQGERRDVSDVTVSGKTVELEPGTAITTGQTVTVTYNDPTAGTNDLFAIQDRSGNDAASLIDQDVTNTSEVSDSTAPEFVRAVMSSDGRSITLTYDEVLDGTSGPGTTDFSVTVDEVSAEPSQVSVSSRTVLLQLGTGVQSLQDVTVSYTDPTGDDDANAIQDVAGNDAVSLVDQEVANASTVLDEVAPVFQSATTSSDGAKIILTYDEILDSANKPATANFEITVHDEERDASTVTVIGKTVELGLGTAVTSGQVVRVAYTDPTANVDDTNAIQDRAGNDASSLTAQDVTNDSGTADGTAPQFVGAVLASDGFTLTLTYDEVLDGTSGPGTTDFSVTVDEVSAEPSQVSVSGRTVLLRLGTGVQSLQDVTVSYTDPTSGDDANAIQDAGGNDAADLDDHKVTNASTVLDRQPPLFQSVAMSTDGATITLTYDEILNDGNGPATANFQIKVQGERRGVSTATVSGKTVALKLATAITTGQTVTVTYNDPTVGIDDLFAIQDRSGNDAASLIDEGVENTSEVTDSTAPKFVRAVMASNGLSITLTYDEVLDDGNGPATTDFTVTVDQVGAEPSQVRVSGRTVVLQLGTGVLSLQDVTVSYTDPSGDDDDSNAIQDVAGNDATSLINQMVVNASTVLDEVAPVFQSGTTSSDGAKIILTYDEILDSANKPATANFDITVEGEERGASTVTVIGKTVELGLGIAVTTGQVVTVAYTDPTADVDDTNAIQDRAGNDAADLIEREITNASGTADGTAPKFVRAVLASDGWTITLTYDEVLDDVNEPATSDFAVTVDGVSAEPSRLDFSGRTVQLHLASVVQSLQDVSVTYTDPTGDDDANAIQDVAGNDAVSLIDQEVANASTVLDRAAPQFVSAATSSDGSMIILTYDEILNSENEPATANFEITVQGERRDVSTVSVSGKTVELSLGSAVTMGQTVIVTYTDPTAGVDDENAIQDRAGNDADSLIGHEFTSTSSVTDTTAPTFVRAVLASDGWTLTLTYDEVLDETNQPATTDFAVTVDGDSEAISSLDVRDRTALLFLVGRVPSLKEVKVSYTDPSANNDANAIQDPAGNDAVSLTDQSVTNASTVLDVRAPEFEDATTSIDGTKVILSYDEVLDSENEPAAGNFEIKAQGESRDVSTVSVSGKTVELGLGSAVTTGQVVLVSYTDSTHGVDDTNAIQDRAGNDAADLYQRDVTNASTVADTRAPRFVRAAMSSNGGTLTLTYDEVLDDTDRPSTGDFAVTVAGQAADVSSVNVSGRAVLVNLDSAVTAGQDVKVTYTDPSADNDANAIQDPAGNDAATLTDQSVANTSTVPDEQAPKFQSAAVSSDGLTLTLTYDEDLDSGNGPRSADFVVSVEGERRTVSTVTVSGTDVALRMAGVITSGLVVAVTYTDPTVGVNDAKAIQDLAGNDAASVSQSVANGSTVADTTPPGFVRAVVSSDGATITLTFDEVLDDDYGPGGTDFTVKVDGESVALSSVSPVLVRGRTVVVGLDTAVRTAQDVTVTYTDPTSGNDNRAIQDPAGNDAATLTDQMVTNASTVPDGRAPEFVSAATSGDGLTITLTFDEILDGQRGPRTANFGVTVQGERRDISAVTVNGKTVALGLGAAITTGQVITVAYTDPTAGLDDANAIQDRAGNDAASLSATVTNASTVADTTAPTFVRAVLSSDGGTIILTYDEVLDDDNTPTSSNFAVTVDEESADHSSNSPVTVRGRTVALGLDSAVTADQDVSVSYTDPTDEVDDPNAIQDPAGNDAASLTDQEVTNASTVPDERAPRFVSAGTSTDGLTIVLTFDEDLDSQRGPRTSDFSVTVQGERRNVSTVTVDGKTVDLALGTVISSGQTVAVIYTDPTAGVDDRNAIQDSVGNDAASLTESVTNNSTVSDSTAPSLVSAETSTDGGRIILTFTEVLDSSNGPQGSDFTVTVDEESVDLSSVSPVTIRGRTVVLGLESAVTAGQSITVTYTDPSATDDTNAVQDTAGNDVATLTDQTVTNRVGQRPSRPSTPGTPSTPPSSPPSSSTPPSRQPSTPQVGLDVALTVPEGPVQVGQTLSYTVTVSNSGTQLLTGVTWRDTTASTATAWQSLGNLAAGASTTATGSFGPMDASHIPHIILTVAVDSDQTEERVVSQQVAVVAVVAAPPAESSTVQTQPSVGLSGERPVPGPGPRVPSSLVLRVVRVLYEVPDVHLAHNIPDLLLTLPDGSETTCNFLTHYESTGGLARWGYTTSEVLEERPGSLTQYYQRGVVDCHERERTWLMERRLAWDHFGGGVDGSEDLGVEPHLLSDQPGQLLGPWSHRVSDYAVDGTYTGFLNFFTALGGVPSFGYPKSDARYDNDPRRQLGIAAATEGFIRQYFQAAVMEFHPNTLAPVMLRLLGDDLRDRRYPNESYKWYSSFASVPPLRVGQIYVAEFVAASPVTAPPLGPPVTPPPAPGVPAKPSTFTVRVDRVLFSEPDAHLAHNIPDLILTQTDGSEARCDFLSSYEATQGLARWGHAISEVLEEYPGTLTQYYQRGVVDCHEREGAWLIERRLVWDYIGGGADGAPDLGVEPGLLSDQPGDLLGPWGHRVSDYAVDGTYTGFLDFFTALGGVDTFGHPKTEARYDDDPRAVLGIAGAPPGVIRQYFQAAVLEYHPDDELQPVKLFLLGQDVRDRLYPNQTYTTLASFGPAAPLSEGQVYTPERVRLAAAVAPLPPVPSTTPPVIPPASPRLGLRVGRVLFSAPDRHLSHNIPNLTMTLDDGSEARCDFLSYYEATYGLARWGHAISEVLEEQPGILTQYYQRGVVDCHQRYGGWSLERRLAWDYIGGGVEGALDLGVEPQLLSDQPGELLGPWGHRVSDYAVDGTYVGFLEFFTALGGVETFGHPKTEARYDDDPLAVLGVPDGDPRVIRQYFQAAVLEYHPSDTFQPVKLFLLGDILRDWRYPAYRAFVAFGPYGPLTPGQTYYPVATSNVIRPAG